MPIEFFLKSKNTYQRHQREFTPSELRKTMNFFSLQVNELLTIDILPTHAELAQSRKIAGRPLPPKPNFTKRFLKVIAKGSLKPSLICRAVRRE